MALQELVSRFGLADDAIESLRSAFRRHAPNLRLPRQSAVVLRELRRDWKLGILTNGHPDIQARKIAALGLSDKVDAVVYGLNTGAGKPELVAFATVLDRLGVQPHESIFVGDDPRCDIMGARRAGMKTIRVRRGVHGRAPVTQDDEADVAVDSLREVPTVAAGLLAPAACHVT
jgi:putative hydrolase of the HAD superfamily